MSEIEKRYEEAVVVLRDKFGFSYWKDILDAIGFRALLEIEEVRRG